MLNFVEVAYRYQIIYKQTNKQTMLQDQMYDKVECWLDEWYRF